MAPRIVPGTASHRLAAMISHHLDDEPVSCTVNRFPDGELRPELATVRGDDVYVVQSTGPPVNDRLVELLLLLDACRRAGAGRITAVVPYFGYARQDRRNHAGQAIGARAVADALTAAGAHRLLVVDPHTPALEAMFAIPVELLTAIPVLVPALADLPTETVVIAPDFGAVQLAERVAAHLDRPVAVVRKTRITGSTVHAEELIGTDDRPVLIVDMISTGATIEAAARMALTRGGAPHITVVATHGLLVGDATERLHALPLRRLVVTDTHVTPRRTTVLGGRPLGRRAARRRDWPAPPRRNRSTRCWIAPPPRRPSIVCPDRNLRLYHRRDGPTTAMCLQPA